MNHATSTMRNLSDYLIARERDSDWPAFHYPLTDNQATLGIVEKLRPQLEELMGETGFRALLMNAFAYSKDEVPWLGEVRLNSDGSFEGFAPSSAEIDAQELSHGGAVVLAWFLGLLMGSIGELLTIQLVLEVWPELSLNGDLPNKDESWEEAAEANYFAQYYEN